MIVAENVRVEIRLKVMRADRVIHAINATFDSTPKGFDCVDVGITTNILLRCVLDDFMGISQLGNVIVAGKFISEDSAITGYILPNHGRKRPCFNIRDYLSCCVPLSLDQSYYSGFTCRTTSPSSGPFAAHVSFIHFNLSGERVNVFSHEFTNLFEYTPSRFISDTQLPLELLGRDTCLSGSHQKDRMKPRAQWGVRLVKDSASRRRYLGGAELAGINFALSYAVVTSNLPALRAIDSFRPTGFLEEVKAGIIGRKLDLQIFNSIGFHVLFSNLILYLYYSINNPCCQGIIA